MVNITGILHTCIPTIPCSTQGVRAGQTNAGGSQDPPQY